MGTLGILGGGVVLLVLIAFQCVEKDFLHGFSSTMKVTNVQMQAGLLGFCMSPLVSQIKNIKQKEDRTSDVVLCEKGPHCVHEDFEHNGGINEDDYDKASIYAILYSLYTNIGKVQYENYTFEFVFNTWGIAPSEVGEDDPQRHGKTSYGWFNHSEELQEYVANRDGQVQIVEIGCGTGAGASHLSTSVFPKSKYMAIDMQKAAIDTCKRLHASDRLDCVHIPTGIGNSGSQVPMPANSVDMVIILETHIAEDKIGPEEIAIFDEIRRILKPGGYFLWGNAIPTDVFVKSEEYFPSVGFQEVDKWNNTQGAVIARDEDAGRVAIYMDAVKSYGWGFHLPYFGEPCFDVADKLIRNFYRDPNTALYLKMVTGQHSYMHYVWKLVE